MKMRIILFTATNMGFQKNCVSQLIECLNDWTADYGKGRHADIIYLDFCKAFDTVPPCLKMTAS